MSEIQFPLGLQGTTGLPMSRRALKNCWNAAGKIIQRPGITQTGTNSRVARGAFEWNGGLYEVASGDLLKITDPDTGAFTVIGAIADTNPIDSAIGFNDAVIIVKGGNGYTLNKSDVLTQMVSPQFQASDSVTHINGRFVYIPTNGDPAFFSDVGAADTIITTSFFDAEELPDQNKVTINYRNILYIGGTDSFEAFRDFGTFPVPFKRLNARFDNGYIGGLIEFNNTFLFVGREKGQDLGIYQFLNGAATKISNEFIDTLLSDHTEQELTDIVTGRFKYRGYDVATFALSDYSFGYFGGNWFELDTQVNGVDIPWQAGYIQSFGLKYYAFFADKMGYLDTINKDYGNPFIRLIDLGFETDKSFNVQSLNYHMSQGFNDNAGSVALQVSDDNVVYSQPLHRNTGVIGKHVSQLEWNYPGGLGIYDDFMGVRISTGEDIDFSGTKLFMDER